MKHKILTFFLACLVPWLAGAQQSANSQNNVAEKDYIAYLFTYFTGNHISEEAVCYAVSTDGYTYWALNDNKPVIDSKIISLPVVCAIRISCVAKTERHSIWWLPIWFLTMDGIPIVPWCC